MFTTSIAKSERKRTVSMLGRSFFSFMMDGSTYLWPFTFVFHREERLNERFLRIGTPTSTCSKDLEEFVLKMLDSNKIDKGIHDYITCRVQ